MLKLLSLCILASGVFPSSPPMVTMPYLLASGGGTESSTADGISASPGSSRESAAEKCFDNTQAEIVACLEKEWTAGQKELKQLSAAVADAIDKWGEKKKYRDIAQKKFRTHCENLKSFFRARSDFDSSLVGGGAGSGHEIQRLRSILETIKQEITHLTRALKEIQTPPGN